MAQVDFERLQKIQKRMVAEGISAFICKLPENVVYLTEYWPHHGFSFVVFSQSGKASLYVPEVELEYTSAEWADVTTFGWGLLKDGDLYENYRRLLTDSLKNLALTGKKIAVEQTMEVTAPTYRAAEPVVPGKPWHDLIAEIFNKSEIVDINPIITDLRSIKTDYELNKLRIANEIAEMGINYAIGNLKPGMTETQIGAMIEYKIRADGPGYKGAKLVRAFADVGAGPVGSTKGTLLIPSTTYKVEKGDLVMIELATDVDGYFSDLTYMSVVGEPSPKQREVYNQLLIAQQAAAAALKDGAGFEDPDKAARKLLEEAGLGKYFVHITGHGVGHRYHEFVPFLMPGITGTLKKGMVTSIEPGVYIDGFGGLRIEDNVAVGNDGPIFLSTPRKPW
jgi:Xaa-Pro aminopeptidase